MSRVYFTLAGVIALVIAFAVGRYTVHKDAVETTTESKQKEVDKNHTVTTIVIKKQPDGTTETTQVIDSTTKNTVNTLVNTSAREEVARQNPVINISLLAGFDYSQPLKPLYGISASKEILGPMTVGVFGLTNHVVGLSIGVNF